jgi:hypothetical protein
VLHHLTDDWVAATAGVRTEWGNCKMRRYGYKESSGNSMENARILKMPDFRKKRTGTEHCFSEEEQMDMREEVETLWEKVGYILIGSESHSERLSSEQVGIRCAIL